MLPSLSSPKQLGIYPKGSAKPFAPHYLTVAEQMTLPKCRSVYKRLPLIKTDYREMLLWDLANGLSQGSIDVVRSSLNQEGAPLDLVYPLIV